MSEFLSKKMSSDTSSLATSHSSQFQDQLEVILDRLKTDPSSITADDARLLSENFNTHNERAVRIISAVEYLAIANKVCTTRNPATLRIITARC